MGFLFSEERINSNDYLYNDYNPQYTDGSTLINDTVNWIKISFEYIGDAPHSFLTVGNFLKDSIASYVEVNPNATAQDHSCYFFLDDFTVKEIEAEVSIQFPNVFTPNGDGSNNEFRPMDTQWDYLEKIDILNRWGNKVISLKSPFIWDGLDSEGNKVTNGVYYYVTQSKFTCKKNKERVGVIHVIY